MIPNDAEILAEGCHYHIFAQDDWIYLRGLGDKDHIFDKRGWDIFASIIARADKYLNGEDDDVQ